jgi:hypothetical protein
MRNLIVFLSLFFSGCVHIHEYPDDWPALEPVSGDCPDISGRYVEIGRTSERPSFVANVNQVTKTGPRLSSELLRADVGANSAVAITQPSANSITISTIYADGVSKPHIGDTSFTFDLDNGDYWCDEGKIWFPNPYGGFSSKRAHRRGISKTIDESLIAEDHSVNVNGKTVTYYLWSAYITE